MSHTQQFAQYNNRRIDSHGPSSSTNTIGKKVACDRCRGQKLRCIWDANAQRCRRCTKAKTICMILPPQPMGRPLGHGHGGNSQSRDHQNQIRRHNQQQTELMQAHLQYAPTCMTMEQDEEDIQDTLTEVTRTESDNTNHETTAHSCADLFPIGQATHLSSPLFPIDNHLQGLDDTASFTPLSFIQNANNSNKTPATFSSDAAFVPSHQDASIMNTNCPDALQFFLPDADSEDGDNRDEELDDEHLSTITHLSRLNLALYKHLAHMNMAGDKCPPTVTIPTSPEGPFTASPKSACVTNLDIGQLLSLTDQFKTLLDQLLLACGQQPHSSQTGTASPYMIASSAKGTGNASSSGSSSGSRGASQRQPYDPSTALLVLSCYFRLKQVYSRALRILHQLLGRERESDDLPELLPDLVIEGFPLAGHRSLQLGVMVQLCEQMFNSIGPRLGLDDSVYTVAPGGLDELVGKIWALLERADTT